MFAGNAVATFTTLRLVPTFNSCSVYADFTGDDNTNSSAAVQYRISGATSWRNAYPPWMDPYRKKFSGSIVYLLPSTAYDVKITVGDSDGVPGTASITNTVTTWSESFVTGSATDSGNTTNSPQTISSSGTSLSSYAAYGPANGRSVLHCDTNYVRCLTIDADNVLIRNIDFVGGGTNAIKVLNNHTNVIINNCTFTKWGMVGKSDGSGNLPDEGNNCAILIGDINDDPGSGTGRIVVQNCTIHDANGGSNSWDQGHPLGPEAIFVSEGTLGQFVFRYNRIYGSTNHFFNDAIGGSQNESTNGFVARDSDIYGNVISDAFDDAIECDGGGENVRVWGNSITNSHVGLSTSIIAIGPVYDFRNLFYYNRASETNLSTRECWHKTGSVGLQQKASFDFLNTVTSPNAPANANEGSAYFTTSRDNIFAVTGKIIYDPDSSTTDSYDWDLIPVGSLSDGPAGTYANAIRGLPTFVSGPYGSGIGNWFLDPASSGYRAGVAIANFADNLDGTAISNPNTGAFDERFTVLLFGPAIQAPVIAIGKSTIGKSFTSQ